MPRQLTIGNGDLLINFDAQYRLRDLYYPHVGQENHLVGHFSRLGVWIGNPDGSDGQFSWVDEPAWQRSLRYEPETLLTHVELANTTLGISIQATDGVDFHKTLFMRQFVIVQTADHPRQVRLFFHHDFHILETAVGDTAYYEPLRRALFHYKKNRWFMINGLREGAEHEGIDQWATGVKEVNGQEGTWRDAEDGVLSGNPIAQGSVDSTIGLHAMVPPGGTATIYYWMAVGKNFEEVRQLNHNIRARHIKTYIERTRSYWALWANARQRDYADLPDAVVSLYKTSLLIIRTQIDNGGAVIAANDYDITQFASDTYSYMWPRDGALVASAMDMAGYDTLSQRFFDFCHKVITPEGYLLHKYTPDGSLASSWHAWYRDGERELPIQEDETGLVLWALWRHYDRYRDTEWFSPLFRALVVRAADWMVAYRDEFGLPEPSWDLWEERRGVHAFTVAAVWAGLRAGANFCTAFGETALADKYRKTAENLKMAVDQYLYRLDTQGSSPRFVRMVMRAHHDPNAEAKTHDEQPLGRSGVTGKDVRATQEIRLQADFVVDWTLDSAIYALWYFGMYAPDDPRIVATMQQLRDRLWCKTAVGGMARYENDYYQQVSQDIQNVPGNPWFICTLWLAQYAIAGAKTLDDLKPAVDILQWTATHALESGVLAEQVNPYTHAPLSVSPLTWSHATVVMTVHEYLNKRTQLLAAQAAPPTAKPSAKAERNSQSPRGKNHS